MLSLSVVTLLLLTTTGVSVWAKFSRLSLMLSVVVLEILGLVLLGLPGAAYLETMQPVMQRFGFSPFSADGAWPAAIGMSVIWPLALVPAYLVARWVPFSNLQRGLVAFSIVVFMCLLLGALVYIMFS